MAKHTVRKTVKSEAEKLGSKHGRMLRSNAKSAKKQVSDAFKFGLVYIKSFVRG